MNLELILNLVTIDTTYNTENYKIYHKMTEYLLNRLISIDLRKNYLLVLGEPRIDHELTTCLLDNGAQLNFMTPTYTLKRGFNVMSLDRLTWEVGGTLPPIRGIGGIMVEPTG